MSYSYSYTDYYKLAGYAVNAEVNHNDAADLQSELLFTGGLMFLPLAYQGAKGLLWDTPKWMWNNKHNYKSAWQELISKRNEAKNATSYLKNKNIFQTINNKANYNSILELEKKLPQKSNYSQWGTLKTEAARKKWINNSKKANYYKKAQELINQAKTQKLTGKALSEQLKKIDRAIAAADLEVHNAIKNGEIKATTKRGKIWAGMKKYSGYNAVNGSIKKGVLSSNKAIRIISKGAKNGGLATAAIGLAAETPEIYNTYKELGAAKGTKQLGKTVAVVAAEGAGYAIGAKIGGVAGAKVGAAIGTCIGGPVGTAIGAGIGAIIGVGTGVLCSWLAGKGAKSIVGKSEIEKSKQEQARKLAKEAAQSDEGKDKLLAKVEERAEKDQGCSDQGIIDSYQKLVEEKQNNITSEVQNTISSETDNIVEPTKTVKSDYTDIINKLENIVASTNSTFSKIA